MKLLEPTLLNGGMDEVAVIDSYSSLIWTDRYQEAGDFELVLPPTDDILAYVSQSSYVRLDESDQYMLIEDLKLETNSVDGDQLFVTGRSYSSILDRRVVWPGIVFDSDLSSLFYDIIANNFQAPVDTNRTISINIDYYPPADSVWDLLIKTQIPQGDNCYNVIVDICKAYGVGFKFVMNPSTGVHTFRAYNGIDRSYDQTTVPVVEFSTQFDNLLSSAYIETERFVKNFAYVGGETGVENARVTIEVPEGVTPETGLTRKELYIEPSINRSTPTGQLTEQQYLDQLERKAEEELAKNIYLQAFDGEVAPDYYQYNVDYGMGDILQISNSYGHSVKSRVVEMIYSQDREGVKIYPTFITVG